MIKKAIGIKIGIEQEFVFKNTDGQYIDFETGSYELFQSIVDKFPLFENDKIYFECKSLEKVPKRCYIEGLERYDTNKNIVKTTPKGLEIRTRPFYEFDKLIAEFSDSFSRMATLSQVMGLYPVLSSSHPFKTDALILYNSLSATEIDKRSKDELENALFSMLWHGMHCNISIDNYDSSELERLVQKLNYYLPYMIPYSFSSPFYNAKLFDGESSRTYFHAPKRELVKIVTRNRVKIIHFAGFDACGDRLLLKALLELLHGVITNQMLEKTAFSQDISKIQTVALQGFDNPTFQAECIELLDAIKNTISDDFTTYDYLKNMALNKRNYASVIKNTFMKTGNIIESISDLYCFDTT